MAGEIDNVTPGEPVESAWGNRIRDRVLSRYLDRTERDFKNPVPDPGDMAYILNTLEVEVFDGVDWIRYTLEPDLVAGLALKVAKAGDIMSGFLTLSADPVVALHAATKQYVDARDLIPQAGALIDSSVFQGATIPTANELATLLHTFTIAIPPNAQGRPVAVSVTTMLRAAAASEGDAFEVWSGIQGGQNLRSTTGFPTVSQGSHTHDIQGSTVTQTASSHTHNIAVGLHTHNARSTTINVGNSSLTASNNHGVEIASPGTSFPVDIWGRIRSGAPATWHLNSQVQTWLAP